MVWQTAKDSDRGSVWALARAQHGVVSRAQLLQHGLTRRAIEHRVSIGRLHHVHRGVYAVGRPELTREARWLAAVLCCGEGAVLSHGSAGVHWGLIHRSPERRVEVSVAVDRRRDDARIRLHYLQVLPESDRRVRRAIPVTSPVRTLIDLSTCLSSDRLEAAINAADRLELVSPDGLRHELDRRAGQRGIPALRRLLDRDTFALTDSELERRFLRLARRAGLPKPRTQVEILGLRVDFYWPELGLVVETDGLRYHRTAQQQARDRKRDQRLQAAGLTALRFTWAQVVREPDEAERTLADVARRLTLEGRAAA